MKYAPGDYVQLNDHGRDWLINETRSLSTRDANFLHQQVQLRVAIDHGYDVYSVDGVSVQLRGKALKPYEIDYSGANPFKPGDWVRLRNEPELVPFYGATVQHEIISDYGLMPFLVAWVDSVSVKGHDAWALSHDWRRFEYAPNKLAERTPEQVADALGVDTRVEVLGGDLKEIIGLVGLVTASPGVRGKDWLNVQIRGCGYSLKRDWVRRTDKPVSSTMAASAPRSLSLAPIFSIGDVVRITDEPYTDQLGEIRCVHPLTVDLMLDNGETVNVRKEYLEYIPRADSHRTRELDPYTTQIRPVVSSCGACSAKFEPSAPKAFATFAYPAPVGLRSGEHTMLCPACAESVAKHIQYLKVNHGPTRTGRT